MRLRISAALCTVFAQSGVASWGLLVLSLPPADAESASAEAQAITRPIRYQEHRHLPIVG